MNICDVRTRWINVDKDVEKAKQMQELLDGLGFTDHQRFSAVTGIEPHEGVRRGEEHYRNCAESHFKLLEETILSDGQPVLILEDDVDFDSTIFTKEIPLPENADAFYYGISHGDGNYDVEKVCDGLLKGNKIFATHAIMHINPEYSKKVIEVGKRWIYERNHPFDVGCAYEVQPNFVVYASEVPPVYQADSKNSVNKWEGLTRTPLRQKKKFSTRTI